MFARQSPAYGESWKERHIASDFDDVVAAARNDEAWATERIYNVLSPRVATYLRAQGLTDPDDVVSEVFVRVFTHLKSFNGTGARFQNLVFTIAHQRLADERRRIRRQPVITDDAELINYPAGNTEVDALNSLGRQRVIKICRTLPRDQRDAMLLRIVAGRTLEETAHILGKTVGAVKALQHRGTQTLRQRYRREDVTP